MDVKLNGIRAAASLAALLSAAPAAAQTHGRMTFSSVDSQGLQGNGPSGSGVAISADGRFVAFGSEASNLVPGDTNLDTDVFVHDHLTGVTERVSLAWNGNEARDDSFCPALSADGRYVAFLSRAWNLYKGGANLGHPRFDVFVRDREAGTTTHVSLAHDGTDPDGDSSCPSISGDGRLVAFSSWATNLVPDDQNGFRDVFVVDWQAHATARVSDAAGGGSAHGESFEPKLSADGRFVAFTSVAHDLLELPPGALPPPPWADQQVFVKDLQTGAIEQVSLSAVNAFGQPDAPSLEPAISGDGRFVAFVSYADDLVPAFPNAPGRRNVYLRDRARGTTVLASRFGSAIGGCGAQGADFCKLGDSFRPAISAGGRFVIFESVSHRLLPANLVDPTQLFLFDRRSERLRRLSVDDTGSPATFCAETAAISADGAQVAFTSYAPNLVANDVNYNYDVFRQEWNCADGGACQPLAACPAHPVTCAPATASTVRLRKHAPGGADPDRFVWRLRAAPDAPPFPDPTAGGTYDVCLYAGPSRRVAFDVAAPDAKACAGAGQPCWQQRPTGFRLRDEAGGLPRVVLRSTPRRRQIDVRGQGPLLGAPDLPLDGTQGMTIQLRSPDGSTCWSAEFPAASISKNIAGSMVADRRTNGWLAMEIR